MTGTGRTAILAASLLLSASMLPSQSVGQESPALESQRPSQWLPANVIGVDGRRPARAAETDLLGAVGVVTCSKAVADGPPAFSRATGTLVGSRSTVLTAAHVFVSDPRRSQSSVEFDAVADCSFRQYDASGEVVAETGFSHAVYGAFRHDAGLPNEDWAVLRTAAALPADSVPLRFAGIGFETLDGVASLPISVLAFHADRRARRRVPLLSEGELFAVDYAGFRRFAHTADMGRMSSGAALVHRTKDGLGVVVGLHRSAANFGDYNLAVPLANELEATLESLAYGAAADPGQRMAASESPGRLRILASRQWTRAR